MTYSPPQSIYYKKNIMATYSSFILSEKEKQRIRNLHESYKMSHGQLIKEQSPTNRPGSPSKVILEKQFCKNGEFNYDKYYSSECDCADVPGNSGDRFESFQGCRDGKTKADAKVNGISWVQAGNCASLVDWVETEDGKTAFVCPKDLGKIPPHVEEIMIK